MHTHQMLRNQPKWSTQYESRVQSVNKHLLNSINVEIFFFEMIFNSIQPMYFLSVTEIVHQID
jgi:hypothetical protein